MEAVAHNPSFAKKVGVPQSVGQDFSKADKGKTFNRGGDMASKMNAGFMAMMAKKKGAQEGSKADMASDKKQLMGMKKMAAGGDSSGGRGMTQTPGDKKLNSPGRYATKILPSSMKPLTKTSSNDMSDDDNKTVSAKKGGYMKKMAGGGLAAGHKSADGIASKGKTKGKMIKMNMGGKAC
jgi:hypothetical protein